MYSSCTPSFAGDGQYCLGIPATELAAALDLHGYTGKRRKTVGLAVQQMSNAMRDYCNDPARRKRDS